MKIMMMFILSATIAMKPESALQAMQQQHNKAVGDLLMIILLILLAGVLFCILMLFRNRETFELQRMINHMTYLHVSINISVHKQDPSFRDKYQTILDKFYTYDKTMWLFWKSKLRSICYDKKYLEYMIKNINDHAHKLLEDEFTIVPQSKTSVKESIDFVFDRLKKVT